MTYFHDKSQSEWTEYEILVTQEFLYFQFPFVAEKIRIIVKQLMK